VVNSKRWYISCRLFYLEKCRECGKRNPVGENFPEIGKRDWRDKAHKTYGLCAECYKRFTKYRPPENRRGIPKVKKPKVVNDGTKLNASGDGVRHG